MKALKIFLIFLFAIMIVAQIIKGFPCKQWKQLTKTVKVYETSRLITPYDSLGETESLTYMYYKVTEYGDTLQKRKFTIKDNLDTKDPVKSFCCFKLTPIGSIQDTVIYMKVKIYLRRDSL